MRPPISPFQKPTHETFTIMIGTIVILIGCLVLAGWQSDNDILTNLIPGKYKMNPTTAISFILAAVAIAGGMEVLRQIKTDPHRFLKVLRNSISGSQPVPVF